MNEQTEKTFINGLISKDVADTAPEWILGKMSIQVDDLKRWLNDNDKLADENGWINLTVKRSQKTNKRYVEVDTWKPKTEPVVSAPVTTSHFDPSTGEAKTQDIPF